jgi:ubiquinone/menaquinone biosynthesis C-methylase UbiE
MPTVDENRTWWGLGYDWPQGGEEWSVGAGGTDYVWHGTIMPRLCGYLPARHILEIAPGRGRFTRHLLGLRGAGLWGRFGSRVTGVDVTPACTAFCRRRFRRQRCLGRASFHTNDGRTLPMIERNSVDLAFSWDSLVHCERDVVKSYLGELSRVLCPGGIGFLHHSNLGNFAPYNPRGLDVQHPGWRAPSMTWQLFRQFCRESGLWCLVQELRTFKQPRLIDCISVCCRPVDPNQEPPEVEFFENDEFYRETQNLRRIAGMYGRRGREDRV